MAVRARFFLTYRLSVRLSQVLIAEGAARTAPWRVAVVAFVALDISTWAVLRRPERFGFKTRLALDAVDAAIWSLGSYTPPSRYNLSLFVGVPLTIETGIRRPRLAALVPAALFLSTSLARFVAGRPFRPWPILWLLLAAVCGLVFARYNDRLRRQAAEDWRHRRIADDQRAYLAGQNSVAMGASSVVDGIEGIVPIIGIPGPGSALWRLADGWKSGLSDRTRIQGTRLEAAYLADALNGWQLAHNRHPDLASRVTLHPAEGIGTMLLTGTQMAVLRDRLDELDARGTYPVSLDPAGSPRRPGAAFALTVGDHHVRVPADAGRPVRSYDPGPAAFALMGILAVADIVGLRTPAPVAAACLGTFLAASAWCHRLVRRRGRAARPMILVAAAVVSIATTGVMSQTMRRPWSPTGMATFPVVSQLDLLGILAGMYRTSVSRRALQLSVAAAAAVVLTAWLLHPDPSRPADLALTTSWPICALVTAWKLSPELDRAAARYADDLRSDDATADERAFERGRSVVIDLTAQASEEAGMRLAALESSLAPTLWSNAHQRLADVEERLRSL